MNIPWWSEVVGNTCLVVGALVCLAGLVSFLAWSLGTVVGIYRGRAEQKLVAELTARIGRELSDMIRWCGYDRGVEASCLRLMDLLNGKSLKDIGAWRQENDFDYKPLSPGIEAAVLERARQVQVEHWTNEHDDDHEDQSLAWAAAHYVCPRPLGLWPPTWDLSYDKRWKHNRLRQLAIGMALAAAEYDRILRMRPIMQQAFLEEAAALDAPKPVLDGETTEAVPVV